MYPAVLLMVFHLCRCYSSDIPCFNNPRIIRRNDLKFDVHISVYRKYISKVQPTRCNVFSIYLFLLIALRVSGCSSAHHQEHKTVHTASGIVKPTLLPAAIVDEMELRSISSTIAAVLV